MSEQNPFSSEPSLPDVETVLEKVNQAISFLENHTQENKDPFATVSFIAYDPETKGKKEIEATISATIAYLKDLLAMKEYGDDLYLKGEMFAVTKITESK